ncbi:MAG: DNA mismatch repair protein MutS [Spirochaetales bacterium]|nr:DNA mismatch repair protein MutS [Spirochaetales bacterium]
MMLQYKKLKQNHMDSILFFRLGDFYEMFEQDAKNVSKLLNLTLTKRNGVPMCGIPYHAAANYIARLIKLGKKIAVCEQTHIPGAGKGIATREVVEIITPGTLIDEGLLERNTNNFLVSIAKVHDVLSFSYIDLSTAIFCATHFSCAEAEDKLKKEFFRLSPREVIVQESLLEEVEVVARLLEEREGIVVNRYPDWYYDLEMNREKVLHQFKVANLKGFGLEDDAAEIVATGIILTYIEEAAKNILPHVRNLSVYTGDTFVGLDESTQKNLELVRNLQDGSKRYTLLEVLDHTRTAMGSRTLYNWILSPLKNVDAINERQKAVSFFYHDQLLLSRVSELLSRVLDIERLSTRVALDKAHAKDLVALQGSLTQILKIYKLLSSYKELNLLQFSAEEKASINYLKELIEGAIQDEPSIQLNEGDIIRSGYNKELDDVRSLKKNAQTVLHNYLNEEKKNTGISSLKLRFNKIIGYYLEVTKSNLERVPVHYIRRQSLVSGDRFTTEILIEKETEINNAAQKILDIEKELFLEVRDKVKTYIDLLFKVGEAVAALDVFQSFAGAATIYGYNCPHVAENGVIKIEEGRHPVVEKNLPGGSFIPNSALLDPAKQFFILLTGPNMAGKSTYLRQIALITLMAQIGSFVPASDAHIGIVDKIFCRVGASDNLARGESTFLVEMNETANILRTATKQSLIIMDEVGRGTGTNDGLSIAWAVTLYILEQVKAKTLFATHFHELTHLTHKHLKNNSLEVLEKQDEIIFLKRVKPGPADSSYGIHVAKLAGLPLQVVESATEIMQQLFNKKTDRAPEIKNRSANEPKQPSLFSLADLLIEQLKLIDVTKITPLEALNLLAKWKDEVSGQEPGNTY